MGARSRWVWVESPMQRGEETIPAHELIIEDSFVRAEIYWDPTKKVWIPKILCRHMPELCSSDLSALKKTVESKLISTLMDAVTKLVVLQEC